MTREEAIKELRGFIGQLTEGCQEAIKVLIPELAESEDERIRKHIIEILDRLAPCHWDGNEKSECIAYLEKQKYSPMPEDTVIFQKGVEEGRRLEREDNKREWSEQDIQYYDAVMEMVMYAAYLPSRPRNEVIKWLKSLRPQPQQNMSIYFMMYLDEHRPDGKMCLSNAECNQIEVAFKNQDWDIILKYAEKYLPRWKPSEEQMEDLNYAIAEWDGGKRLEGLYALRNDLKKLM